MELHLFWQWLMVAAQVFGKIVFAVKGGEIERSQLHHGFLRGLGLLQDMVIFGIIRHDAVDHGGASQHLEELCHTAEQNRTSHRSYPS